jgi:ribonuclease P protein component
LTTERLPKSFRIGRAQELRALMTEGKRRRTDHLDLFIRPSPLEHSRLAVIVARFGHTAPQRNQLRRRLREILRRAVLPVLSEPADLAVRARPAAYGAGFDRLRAEIVGTLCPSSPASPS